MPSGSLVTLVSIRLCSVSAICLYPLTAESSCEVTELQLHLRCSCKRKLLFLTMVLNIHCWFVLKEHYQNLKLWVMSASFMFLNFVCVFRHRPPPPPSAHVVFWLKFVNIFFLLPDTLTFCSVCWSQSEVVLSKALNSPALHHHQHCCLPHLHYWTCCRTAKRQDTR